jgi:uncharacterized protein
LHEAASSGAIHVASALLQRGANVNARITIGGSSGYTPLDFAASSCDVPMVKLLLTEGADVTLKTTDGKTAIQIAEQARCDRVVDVLRAAVPPSKKRKP